ncbi:MAG: hypothetical protein GY823_09135 [Flavobacteriaceae bacterium]|nr:hypothetical protein [Flavobacteriaceae bacterium]
MDEERFGVLLTEKLNAFKLDIENKIATTSESLKADIVNVEKAVSSRFLTIEKKLLDIEKAQDFQATQYESFRKQVGTVLRINTELKAENEHLCKRIKDLELKDRKLMKSIDDLEQYGRREMLELSGVPRLQNENCEEIMLKLAEAINVPLSRQEIEACHRNSPKPDAPIISKFGSRKLKELFFTKDAKKVLRNLTTEDLGFEKEVGKDRIFINESLTKANKHLLWLAKNKKKDLEMKFCWTRNGSIFLRKSETTPIVKVNYAEDLDKLS